MVTRSDAAPQARGKLGTIQHLRAVAALGVVLYHATSQVYGGESAYLRMGAAGVDLFFIISGFIMWATAVARDENPGRFAVKRLIRIVPLYWLVTTAVVLVVLAAPNLMRSSSLDAAHIAASYGFIAWPHPRNTDRFWPLLIPGWTLNYEMLFYAIVTGALFLKRRFRLPGIAAALILPVLAGRMLHPQSTLAFYTDPILLEFLFGIGVGALYTQGASVTRPIGYAAICAGIVSFLLAGPYGTDLNRALTWGAPMALLVLGAVNVPKILPDRPFRLLGDASYSLYLSQFCVVGPCARLLAPLAGRNDAKLLAVAALIVVACAIGVATYYFIEAPLTKALRAMLEKRSASASQAHTLRVEPSQH
ncbi:MAG: acyltransferase [Gammaproteobacteria bacterium]